MATFPESRMLSLEPGDHLTRAEFERRYEAMPELKKAELIEGVVYMPSPVRWDRHSRPHSCIVAWLGAYAAKTPGVQVGDNATVRLDDANEPQPGALLIIEPSRGGQAKISSDDYLQGSPELVAEIAASSASFDLHTKYQVYERNGVQEYIVWRVLDEAIDWFRLRNGQFGRLEIASDGILRSEVFPGLWLDPPAICEFNLPLVFETLERGLSSPEHAAFTRLLQNS
jgi:Uma2 family endonuclease